MRVRKRFSPPIFGEYGRDACGHGVERVHSVEDVDLSVLSSHVHVVGHLQEQPRFQKAGQHLQPSV